MMSDQAWMDLCKRRGGGHDAETQGCGGHGGGKGGVYAHTKLGREGSKNKHEKKEADYAADASGENGFRYCTVTSRLI